MGQDERILIRACGIRVCRRRKAGSEDGNRIANEGIKGNYASVWGSEHVLIRKGSVDMARNRMKNIGRRILRTGTRDEEGGYGD